jgi:hypothetical protein
MMEACFYKTTWCNIPEYSHVHDLKNILKFVDRTLLSIMSKFGHLNTLILLLT